MSKISNKISNNTSNNISKIEFYNIEQLIESGENPFNDCDIPYIPPKKQKDTRPVFYYRCEAPNGSLSRGNETLH